MVSYFSIASSFFASPCLSASLIFFVHIFIMVIRSFCFTYNDSQAKTKGHLLLHGFHMNGALDVTSKSKPSMEMDGINWLSRPTYTHIHIPYHVKNAILFVLFIYARYLWHIRHIEILQKNMENSWYLISYTYSIRWLTLSYCSNVALLVLSLSPALCPFFYACHNIIQWHQIDAAYRLSIVHLYVLILRSRVEKKRTQVKVLVRHYPCDSCWWVFQLIWSNTKDQGERNRRQQQQAHTSFFSHFQ